MDRRFAALIILAVALAGPAFADPADDAVRRGDYASALQIWRPLADRGQAAAQYNMGVLYQRGQGVPQDNAEAVRWWRLAVAQGYGPAQSNLGVAYAQGRGVAQDDREALRLFRLAAGQGLAPGEFNLGTMYQHGRGVTRDSGTPRATVSLCGDAGP